MAPEVDEVAAEGLDVEAISDIREFCVENPILEFPIKGIYHES
jgi:hypothetical protein